MFKNGNEVAYYLLRNVIGQELAVEEIFGSSLDFSVGAGVYFLTLLDKDGIILR